MSLFDPVPLGRLLRRLAFGRGRPVAQPVPDVAPSDVERVVRRDFPNDQCAEIMSLLDDCGKNNGLRGGPRVQLAALKLAKGSMEKLGPLVESARRDYRNVLLWAEYPSYHRIGFHIRNYLSKSNAGSLMPMEAIRRDGFDNDSTVGDTSPFHRHRPRHASWVSAKRPTTQWLIESSVAPHSSCISEADHVPQHHPHPARHPQRHRQNRPRRFRAPAFRHRYRTYLRTHWLPRDARWTRQDAASQGAWRHPASP